MLSAGLAQDERAIYALRSIYEGMGYEKFKMSKFEEYDLYLENKSFLPTEGIVTFTDKYGRLMALKPDVTLSILKSMTDSEAQPSKLYYNENVYRFSRDIGDIREIMQVGLEYVGEISLYAKVEVLSLACESLAVLDSDYILDVSHMGLVMGLLEEARISERAVKTAVDCISSKSEHELRRVLRAECVSEDIIERLASLVSLGGETHAVLAKAEEIAIGERANKAVRKLKELFAVLEETCDITKIRLDFSIVNDMSYYNGIIFRGYVNGIPEGILAGGQYDTLVHRLTKCSGAIGYALYMNLLEHRREAEPEFDVDVLIICDSDDCAKTAAMRAKSLREEGKTVRVSPKIGKTRAREIIEL